MLSGRHNITTIQAPLQRRKVAFGSGYRPDNQQYYTFFNQSGSFNDPHGHAVWHYGQNGQVIYDHMRDVQGNVYTNRDSGMYRFLGDIALNGR